MNRELRIASMCLSVGSLLAMAGCSSPAVTPGTDAGTGGVDANVDAGGGGGDGGPGVDSGGGGASCASQATSYCARFAECSPELFIASFEDMPTCVEVQTAACADTGGIPMTNGVVDQAGCITARTAGCAAFLDPVLPAACLPAPGDVAQNGECGVDAQCANGTDSDGHATRLYCYGATSIACMDGVCAAPDQAMSGRNTCMNSTTFRDNCDTVGGFFCTAEFDPDTANHLNPDGNTCLERVYGTAGDDCAPGSDHVCAGGFACHAGTSTCMAVLAEGSACDPLASLCDARLGQYCGDDGDGNNVCLGPSYVHIGAQCGVVDGVMQTCSAYAICNSATPTVCEARRVLGATCTATPDNCRVGLVCMGGTCQEPDPVTCP
jgi:hypothetical protein